MFSLFNKKKVVKESVFIHIPKTGGSTFVGLLKDSIKDKTTNIALPTHKTDRVGAVTISHVDFTSPKSSS